VHALPAAVGIAALTAGNGLLWADAQRAGDQRVFRSAIALTTINATVFDREGRLATNLTQDVFEVFEDGEPQTITQFTRGRVPVSLGVLLDISDSMFGRRIEDARAAVVGFLTGRLASDDEFSVTVFNHGSHPVTDWAADRASIGPLLDRIKPFGGTAAYDAIVSMLPRFETRNRQRAALLVISDGADTASDASVRDVRSALLRSDAFVYAVAIDSPEPRAINTRVNPSALQEITDQSGGRTEVVHGSGELADALSRIADELNSQYLLGYSSPRATDGRYHSIRVRIRGGEHRVRARNGYVGRP
jgi:VWFA-related protein